MRFCNYDLLVYNDLAFLPHMFSTSGDILNLVLAVSIGFVAFFLSFLLFYAILIVRDVNFTTRKVRQMTETINEYVSKPAKAVIALTEKLKLITHFLENYGRKKKVKREEEIV